MRRVRWACPNGCAGVLASSRPRLDDVARFCLACSAKTGRLVKRSAPALDKARAFAAERSHAHRADAAERESAAELARWSVAGVDMREALRTAWNLPVAREWLSQRSTYRHLPTLHLRRSAKYIRGRLGAAWWARHHIQVRTVIGRTEATRELGTLLHEVAHLLVWRNGRESHGRAFRVCLARLHQEWDERADTCGLPKVGPVRERFSVDVPEEPETAATTEGGGA